MVTPCDEGPACGRAEETECGEWAKGRVGVTRYLIS